MQIRALAAAFAASLVCSSLLIATSVVAAPVVSLFDAPPAVDPSGPRAVHGHAALRRRAVSPRLDVLARPDGSSALGAGDRVQLDLFGDASFSMTVTGVADQPAGGRAWTGTLDGVDLGSAVLALHGGALAGRVVTPGAVYRIGHASDGTPVVEEIDEAALPPEAPPIVPVIPSAADAMKLGGESLDAAADSASQMDVIVLYTAAARAAAGGTAAMQAEASLAVASANQAYANNGLVQRLRLVFSGEISMTEGDFNADLDAVQAHPLVGWLRDVTRADLVALIVDHGPSAQYCGLGYLLEHNSTAFAPYAFAVVERVCASANLTFAHELGHNMGAHHDAYVAVGQPTVFPYSHGYVDLVGRFRTVMSYNDECGNAGFTCTRIPFFSTPDLTRNGRPIGTAATSDNARTLGQTAGAVANFRQSVASPLTLATGVNKAAVAVGETLVVSVSLANGGAVAGAADVYAGLLLPDGSAVFFTDVTITPAGGYAQGHIVNLGSYRPIATGVPLGSPFAASFPAFLSYRRGGGDPAGGFAVFLLVTTSGALADGVLDPNELLGASLAPFTFPAAKP